MIRRSCLLALLGCLTLACASERGANEQKQPAQTDEGPAAKGEKDLPTKELPKKEPPVGEPPVFEGEKVRVGDGPLPFTLALGDSGMSGDRSGDGDYLTLSGPPGGPLMLRVYPATVGADLEKLIAGLRPEAEFIATRVSLLGTEHPAVTWITGEGMARTAWCAVIVSPTNADPGKPALLLEFGVGHRGEGGDCKTAREHHVLGPVLESLKFG